MRPEDDPVHTMERYRRAAWDLLTMILTRLVLDRGEREDFLVDLKENIASGVGCSEEELDPEVYAIVERYFRTSLLDDLDDEAGHLKLLPGGLKMVDSPDPVPESLQRALSKMERAVEDDLMEETTDEPLFTLPAIRADSEDDERVERLCRERVRQIERRALSGSSPCVSPLRLPGPQRVEPTQGPTSDRPGGMAASYDLFSNELEES